MPKRTVDSVKVRNAIKNFLEKMKACDEDIPEELADDALEMTEEVNDALCVESEDEDVIEEKADVTDEELETKIEDSLTKVLRKHGLITDSSTKALDELEAELTDDEEETNTLDADNEEEVIVDADKCGDSAASIRNIIRSVKPVIANVSDARARKKLTDSFVKIAKLSRKNADYFGISKTANDSAKEKMNMKSSVVDSDIDFGMNVAKNWNPHYKEDK